MTNKGVITSEQETVIAAGKSAAEGANTSHISCGIEAARSNVRQKR